MSNLPASDEQGSEGEPLTRALFAFVRAEFEAPVSAITGLIDLLIEDAAAEERQRYRSDLEAMRKAGEQLRRLVTSLLDGAAPETSDPDALHRVSARLRHDLRTPVTAILGYGELVSEDAREAGDTGLIETLSAVFDAARELMAQINDLVAFAGASRDGTSADFIGMTGDAAMVRQATDAIRWVIEEAPLETYPAHGRILLADDNVSILNLMSKRLEREGHEVETFETGEAALEALATVRFDLALLDLMIPGMNGFDLLRHIRSGPTTASLPVIMISALDETETAIRCIEAGADDYLPKPANPVLLRARIGAALERKFLRDRELAITDKLKAEQEHSEQLLRNVLPGTIVERLRAGESVIADTLSAVTVLFCDLVGFTALTSSLSPAETLDLLNGIFSGFDRLAAEYDLEKIKTIGDAYMVAGGAPEPRADHAVAVARMGLRMPEVARRASAERGHPMEVRVGIHTGPAIGGIIGTRKFLYDVWGDTVNIASRMEQYSEPGRIQVSAETRAALGDSFLFETRPIQDIHGKGPMQTFYLYGLRSHSH